MDFIAVAAYNNYIEANIILGRLQQEGIDCWLKDENTSTIVPIWNQATGGIRLMVLESDVQKAEELIRQFILEKKQSTVCPYCKSSDIEQVSTPRKAINWLSAITTFFTSDYAMAIEKVYHCFNCKKEFKEPEEIKPQ
jgi:DNA-directed RNA polymerase subunit RPC12/RpoP